MRRSFLQDSYVLDLFDSNCSGSFTLFSFPIFSSPLIFLLLLSFLNPRSHLFCDIPLSFLFTFHFLYHDHTAIHTLLIFLVLRFDEIMLKPEDLRKDILLFRNGKVLRKCYSHIKSPTNHMIRLCILVLYHYLIARKQNHR